VFLPADLRSRIDVDLPLLLIQLPLGIEPVFGVDDRMDPHFFQVVRMGVSAVDVVVVVVVTVAIDAEQLVDAVPPLEGGEVPLLGLEVTKGEHVLHLEVFCILLLQGDQVSETAGTLALVSHTGFLSLGLHELQFRF